MITIVDYGMGNLGSIANIIRKVGGDAQITADPAVIAAATKLVLPGVGAFDTGMRNLRGCGLIEVLERRVLRDGVPILGLCLGMQLFTRSSEEGAEPGLGWIDARTVRFHLRPEHSGLKIPHMGWNLLRAERESPLLRGLAADARFYFVHSFHLECADAALALATTTHGYRFACGVARGNIMGLQFHPEKSHRFGMQIFRNYLENF